MRQLPTKPRETIGVRSLAERAEPGIHSPLPNRPAAATAPLLKLLRFPAVQERTGLSRSTIWRLEQRGAFPRHHRISTNTVAWVEEEITAWISSKIGEVAV